MYTPRIENFQKVATVNVSPRSFFVVFSFDLLTRDLNINIADQDIYFHLRWETANKSSSGVIYLIVIRAHGFAQANYTTEDAVTYYFNVGASAFGEGPLLLTLSARLPCIGYSSSYCIGHPHPWCPCFEWQYGVESGTILIDAKKGKTAGARGSEIYSTVHIITRNFYPHSIFCHLGIHAKNNLTIMHRVCLFVPYTNRHRCVVRRETCHAG